MAAPSLYGFALGPSSVYGVTDCVKRVTVTVNTRVWFSSRPSAVLASRETHTEDPMPAFTDLRARTNAGEDVSFDIFTGKVVLVVNVARL